jgi:CRP-like cAMP-binding protein
MSGITVRLTRRLEHFAPLSPQERALLQETATSVRRFESRDDLAKQGAPLPGLLAITYGFAARYKLLPDGRRQLLALLLPGDVCDPRALLSPQMDHSIAALGPVEAVVFPEDAVRQLEERPALARALARSALVHEAIGRQWLLSVGHRSSFERITHLFCEIHARLDAVGLAPGRACDVPLTQVDIADTVAITPVHVNRTLMELRRTRLVTFQNKRLVIHDLRSLQRAAGFDPSYLCVPALAETAEFLREK